MSLEVEELPSADGLRPEWQALWDRSPDATPFQHPAWLLPWWRHFGDGEPLVLAVRRAGRLVGLAHYYIRDEPDGRKLLPQGIGISDYLDPLLASEDGEAAAAAILAHLAGQAHRFERADLECLRADLPLATVPPPSGWSAPPEPRGPCPVLTLAAVAQGAGRSRFARLPNYRRRLERMGRVRVETADAASLDGLLDALLALHGQRWQRRGEPGVLADATVQAFHRDAARELLAAGLLRLHALRLEGRIVAAFHGFADRSRTHYYIGGFDPDVPHPGLGTLMLGQAILTAIGEGKRELHFLRGREAYKYGWGAVDRASCARGLRPACGARE